MSLFSYGLRWTLGHPHCDSSYLERVERCEGRNFSIMQGRLHAIAIYGQSVKDVESKILGDSKYSMQQIGCSDLVGGFGQRCYSGVYQAKTGDTYYLNIYLQESKALILEAVNVPILVSKSMQENQFKLHANDQETYHDGHKTAELVTFLDINRFASFE